MQEKLIVFSAPSGAGKTSIVRALLKKIPQLSFSVSATSRSMRNGETHGVDYYFMSPEGFRQRIENGDFLEWEEVYPGSYYGTLQSEVQRIWDEGRQVVFDVDVAGGLTIKRFYGERCLALFIMPPSIEVLEQRLTGRNTETADGIARRISKAEQEMSFAKQFDRIIINDILDDAIEEAAALVTDFINQQT